MNFDALKAIFENFDIASFLPDLTHVMGWVETLLRLAVMAGPLLLLGFGLVFLLAPPAEANYGLGYRCWWGMASLESWRFTQRLAGLVWIPLGALLTIVMGLICNGFRRMTPMDMVDCGIRCLLWELGIVAVACIAINIVVICVFDRQGYRRERH